MREQITATLAAPINSHVFSTPRTTNEINIARFQSSIVYKSIRQRKKNVWDVFITHKRAIETSEQPRRKDASLHKAPSRLNFVIFLFQIAFNTFFSSRYCVPWRGKGGRLKRGGRENWRGNSHVSSALVNEKKKKKLNQQLAHTWQHVINRLKLLCENALKEKESGLNEKLYILEFNPDTICAFLS